ncbi:hypothetical protein EDC01DRAFT_627006 [Geopyxis carbonaria]|nr:hypothetical protein EDC01DRAFT_627006 [Geopyxis carbonaria]
MSISPQTPLAFEAGEKTLSGFSITVTETPRATATYSRHLPSEILHEIFLHLPPHSYDSARLVSRAWFCASLSRPLLLQNLQRLRSSTNPAGRTATAVETADINSLRRAFAAELASWPGSRRKMACGRLVLKTKARDVEVLGFSEPSGTFAAKVAGGLVTVWRLFLGVEGTLGYKPRRRRIGGVDQPRSAPWKSVYCTLHLRKQSRVLAIEMTEHPVFSALRSVTVRYFDGSTETRPFCEFTDATSGERYEDRRGVTYKRTGPHRALVHLHHPPRTSATPTCERLLLTTIAGAVPSLCPALIIPGGGNLIVTSSHELLLTYPTPAGPMRIRYRLTPPARNSTSTNPPRITHVSIAPRHFYDFGSFTWRAAVAAAYDNGERLLWLLDVDAGPSDAAPYVASLSVVVPPVWSQTPRPFRLDLDESGIEAASAKWLGWSQEPVVAMSFVGRGQTLLVGTEKEVEVVEFRVSDGFECSVLGSDLESGSGEMQGEQVKAN